jgi:adsorption protein B
MRYLYWFWRDRKSVIGNLVTPLTNLIYGYGVVTRALAAATGTEWGLAKEAGHFAPAVAAGLTLQALHVSFRIWCSWRVYGPGFACGVPVRVVAGNWINCFATCRAVWTYANAKLRGRPLRWVKTEHAYPSRTALLPDRKRLGEVLTGSAWVTPTQLERALASQPKNVRLGEHLVSIGVLSEDDLYMALALQNQLEIGKPAPEQISPQVTRALPASVARKWKVLPFRVAAGELYLAGAELPADEMQQEIRQFSSLDIRFRLVTPTEFHVMAEQYLAPLEAAQV